MQINDSQSFELRSEETQTSRDITHGLTYESNKVLQTTFSGATALIIKLNQVYNCKDSRAMKNDAYRKQELDKNEVFKAEMLNAAKYFICHESMLSNLGIANNTNYALWEKKIQMLEIGSFLLQYKNFLEPHCHRILNIDIETIHAKIILQKFKNISCKLTYEDKDYLLHLFDATIYLLVAENLEQYKSIKELVVSGWRPICSQIITKALQLNWHKLTLDAYTYRADKRWLDLVSQSRSLQDLSINVTDCLDLDVLEDIQQAIAQHNNFLQNNQLASLTLRGSVIYEQFDQVWQSIANINCNKINLLLAIKNSWLFDLEGMSHHVEQNVKMHYIHLLFADSENKYNNFYLRNSFNSAIEHESKTFMISVMNKGLYESCKKISYNKRLKIIIAYYNKFEKLNYKTFYPVNHDNELPQLDYKTFYYPNHNNHLSVKCSPLEKELAKFWQADNIGVRIKNMIPDPVNFYQQIYEQFLGQEQVDCQKLLRKFVHSCSLATLLVLREVLQEQYYRDCLTIRNIVNEKNSYLEPIILQYQSELLTLVSNRLLMYLIIGVTKPKGTILSNQKNNLSKTFLNNGLMLKILEFTDLAIWTKNVYCYYIDSQGNYQERLARRNNDPECKNQFQQQLAANKYQVLKRDFILYKYGNPYRKKGKITFNGAKTLTISLKKVELASEGEIKLLASRLEDSPIAQRIAEHADYIMNYCHAQTNTLSPDPSMIQSIFAISPKVHTEAAKNFSSYIMGPMIIKNLAQNKSLEELIIEDDYYTNEKNQSILIEGILKITTLRKLILNNTPFHSFPNFLIKMSQHPLLQNVEINCTNTAVDIDKLLDIIEALKVGKKLATFTLRATLMPARINQNIINKVIEIIEHNEKCSKFNLLLLLNSEIGLQQTDYCQILKAITRNDELRYVSIITSGYNCHLERNQDDFCMNNKSKIVKISVRSTEEYDWCKMIIWQYNLQFIVIHKPKNNFYQSDILDYSALFSPKNNFSDDCSALEKKSAQFWHNDNVSIGNNLRALAPKDAFVIFIHDIYQKCLELSNRSLKTIKTAIKSYGQSSGLCKLIVLSQAESPEWYGKDKKNIIKLLQTLKYNSQQLFYKELIFSSQLEDSEKYFDEIVHFDWRWQPQAVVTEMLWTFVINGIRGSRLCKGQKREHHNALSKKFLLHILQLTKHLGLWVKQIHDNYHEISQENLNENNHVQINGIVEEEKMHHD